MFKEPTKHGILHNTLTNIRFPCHNCLVLPTCESSLRYIDCSTSLGEWTYMVGFDYFSQLLRRLNTTHLLKVEYSIDYSYIFDAAIEVLTLEIHALLYDGRVITFNFEDDSVFDSSLAFFDEKYRQQVIINMKNHSVFYSNLTEYHKDFPPEHS